MLATALATALASALATALATAGHCTARHSELCMYAMRNALAFHSASSRTHVRACADSLSLTHLVDPLATRASILPS